MNHFLPPRAALAHMTPPLAVSARVLLLEPLPEECVFGWRDFAEPVPRLARQGDEGTPRRQAVLTPPKVGARPARPPLSGGLGGVRRFAMKCRISPQAPHFVA